MPVLLCKSHDLFSPVPCAKKTTYTHLRRDSFLADRRVLHNGRMPSGQEEGFRKLQQHTTSSSVDRASDEGRSKREVKGLLLRGKKIHFSAFLLKMASTRSPPLMLYPLLLLFLRSLYPDRAYFLQDEWWCCYVECSTYVHTRVLKRKPTTTYRENPPEKNVV